jgi:hypothetical protein
MKAIESNAFVFESHAANQGAVGEECNVHGRESEEGVHHVGR